MIFQHLNVAPSRRSGKGVFAKKNIKAATVIEISPVIVLNVKERRHVEKTILTNYIFEWGDSHRKAALALGYVSMYNHDYSSNCEYEMDFDEKIITIKTVRDIKKGEELYINYNAQPDNKSKVWFDKN